MTTKNTLKIMSPQLVNSLFIGNFKAAFSGRGIEFQDFREYAPGDDAKYIDWARSSQEGKTIMRRYREEKQGTVLAILDLNESLNFGKDKIKKQLALQVIELLAYASFGSGERFGGYILGENKALYVPPKKSKTSLYQMIDIERVFPKPVGLILDLKEVIKDPLKKAVLFVVSDSLEIDEKSFSIAALKHDIIYVHISSHFENTLSGDGLTLFKGQSKILGINLDDMKLRKIYKKERAEKLKIFEKKLRNLGIESIFLNETKSIFAEFLKLMKGRE